MFEWLRHKNLRVCDQACQANLKWGSGQKETNNQFTDFEFHNMIFFRYLWEYV